MTPPSPRKIALRVGARVPVTHAAGLERASRFGSRGALSAVWAAAVLVDGRYEAARPETERLWAGSTNQRFHYLTDRYTAAIERPAPGEALRSVEIRLTADGRLSLNGWPALARGGAGPW